jgi:hypothetical protein
MMKSDPLDVSKTSSPAVTHDTDPDWHGNTESITESESDGFNDNASVSDTLSFSSRAIKKVDFKKIAASMHRLKQENAALRDSLTRMNATDVALLRVKLRGANADMQQLKQLNSQLKERVQILEEKLVYIASEQSDSRVSAQERIRIRLQQAQTRSKQSEAKSSERSMNRSSGDDINLITNHLPSSSADMSAMEQQVRQWQRKHRHAEKLLQSYEVRMQLMQVHCIMLYLIGHACT